MNKFTDFFEPKQAQNPPLLQPLPASPSATTMHTKLPTVRPALVVLRALAASSRHPLLRDYNVRSLHLAPAGRSRAAPPVTLNNSARLLMLPSFHLGLPLTQPADREPALFDALSVGLHKQGAVLRPTRDIPHPFPLPDFSRLAALLGRLDDRKPWQDQPEFLDPSRYLLADPQCVLWVTAGRTAPGNSHPGRPRSDEPLVALVVNNCATSDDGLIDVPASKRLSGAESMPCVLRVLDYLSDWLGVIFHPAGSSVVRTEAQAAEAQGRTGRPGRPRKLPQPLPAAPHPDSATLALLVARVRALADEMEGAGQVAAADVVLDLLDGLDGVDLPD